MNSPKQQIPNGITRAHVLSAITRINQSGHAPHGKSVRYVVEHEGRHYPPIALVAFAIEEYTGTPVAKGSLPGGANTRTFSILREAGFNPMKK